MEEEKTKVMVSWIGAALGEEPAAASLRAMMCWRSVALKGEAEAAEARAARCSARHWLRVPLLGEVR